jgi:hypothetical protein
MSAERSDKPDDHPLALLELAFIAEFLQGRGYTPSTLHQLPEDQAHALLKEASLYASGKLAEVESRAHYVDDMHHGAQPTPGRAHGRAT